MSSVLKIRFQDGSSTPPIRVVCPGFELREWRASALVQDLFDRHLLSFALNYTELEAVNDESAASSLRKAAQSVYGTQKYQRRGEFGELILHAILRDFYGAQPAVSKIYFKDGPNETVKGFDSVHIVENGDSGEIELWLGEVKFYSSLTAGIRDVTAEIAAHLSANFLRSEFVAVTNKLDSTWAHSAQVKELLDENASLDEITESLVVPILLTYDSSTLSSHEAVSDEYLQGLKEEAATAIKSISEKLKIDLRIRVEVILLPLKDKKRLVDLFHQKLQIWKNI